MSEIAVIALAEAVLKALWGLIGHDVNTAARIVDQAGPGETLLSEDLAHRCDADQAGVELRPIGPVRMKGLPTAIWLYRLA